MASKKQAKYSFGDEAQRIINKYAMRTRMGDKAAEEALNQELSILEQEHREARQNILDEAVNTLQSIGAISDNMGYQEDGYAAPQYAAMGGKIRIKPENRGKFTASANQAGMGVQEYASHVLANKEDFSPTQVKRANFARNAAGWRRKAMGGEMYIPYGYGGKMLYQFGDDYPVDYTGAPAGVLGDASGNVGENLITNIPEGNVMGPPYIEFGDETQDQTLLPFEEGASNLPYRAVPPQGSPGAPTGPAPEEGHPFSGPNPYQNVYNPDQINPWVVGAQALPDVAGAIYSALPGQQIDYTPIQAEEVNVDDQIAAINEQTARTQGALRDVRRRNPNAALYAQIAGNVELADKAGQAKAGVYGEAERMNQAARQRAAEQNAQMDFAAQEIERRRKDNKATQTMQHLANLGTLTGDVYGDYQKMQQQKKIMDEMMKTGQYEWYQDPSTGQLSIQRREDQ